MKLSSPVGFQLLAPASPSKAGLVFASPHSGRLVPQDMQPEASLDEASLHSACDVAVDHLLARAPSMGGPLLVGQVSRAYVDLNRAEHELDPQLISGLADEASVSPKTRAGYGVVPRLSGDGRPLYDRSLTLTEVQQRLDQVHRPYHQALSTQMQQAKARLGRAVLIDWHSMPARATGQGGPDVVLGDRYGTSCRTDLSRQITALFQVLGWKVSLNRPYAGGYATQVWGRPDEGYEAIQIELNRALYWDEVADQKSAGWGRCQSGINRVLKALCADGPA